MTPDATAPGQGPPGSPLGRRGAVEIAIWQRIALGVLGALAATGGTLLLLRPQSPELAGTALMIIAALFFSLMVIGRLPKILEVTGVPLEFEKDEMSEFLRTLRAAVDTDTVAELEEQLRNMSSDSKAFKAAQALADADPESIDPTSPTRRTSALATDPDWLTTLKTPGDTVTVEKDARVPGGAGSGRGQPPVVDYLVRVNGEATVAVERASAWNESTLRVLARRLDRVASNLPSIKELLVIMPDEGMDDATAWRDRQWGLDSHKKVRLLAENSDAAAAVESWIDSLPRPRG